jgi:hypothetical protein
MQSPYPFSIESKIVTNPRGEYINDRILRNVLFYGLHRRERP